VYCRRRLPLCLFLAAVLVGLAIGVWLVWPRPTAINRDNAAKIKEGMTLAEVETILVGPPRDDGVALLAFHRPDGSEVTMSHSELRGSLNLQPDVKHWLSDEVLVEITLDDAGRVTSVTIEPVQLARVGPLARLCRWLGL
jgi:hypothetical protein